MVSYPYSSHSSNGLNKLCKLNSRQTRLAQTSIEVYRKYAVITSVGGNAL